MTPLVRPGFIVAVFVPIGGSATDAATARDHLARLWSAAARLGMSDPLLDGLPTDFPDLPTADEPTFRLLAGRSHVDDAGVQQAYLFARHDVIGLCVARASAGQAEAWGRWSQLATEWDAAVGAIDMPASLLGSSRVFVGHVDRPVADLPGLGEEISAGLRDAGLDVWEPAYRTADDACLWWWRDADQRRIVTVLSRPEKEDALSRWLWWRDEREAADLVLYLVNAAKLDYESRVHIARRRAMSGSLREIDQGLDDVLSLHGRLGPEGRISLPGLLAAQDRLIAAQTAAASVVIELTYLKALKRTVAIARRNLDRLVPPGAEGVPPSDSMFQRDQDLAGWLEEQIDQDLGYAEAVVARAREAHSLTALRLQQASTRVTRVQSRVTLMQTSLIGALVASVGATALLKITVAPPEAARFPLLFFFVALLLAAPVLAAHWFEPYGPVDRLAGAVLGGAIGWLILGLTVGEPTAVAVALAVAAGASGALGLVRLHDRRVIPRVG